MPDDEERAAATPLGPTVLADMLAARFSEFKLPVEVWIRGGMLGEEEGNAEAEGDEGGVATKLRSRPELLLVLLKIIGHSLAGVKCAMNSNVTLADFERKMGRSRPGVQRIRGRS